jgi:Carboxypeptidase regulatory-like domain
VQLETPVSVSITLSGTVRDAGTTAGLPGAEVRITTGPDASRTATTDASGNYTLPGLKVGIFTTRFSREGFEIIERPLNVNQDTRLDVSLRRGLPCVAPQPPTALRAAVVDTRVTFTWAPGAGATSYLLVVGTSQGSSNTLSINTTQATYQWRGAPAGTYFARVFARNDCTHDTVSNEVTFTVVPL